MVTPSIHVPTIWNGSCDPASKYSRPLPSAPLGFIRPSCLGSPIVIFSKILIPTGIPAARSAA